MEHANRRANTGVTTDLEAIPASTPRHGAELQRESPLLADAERHRIQDAAWKRRSEALAFAYFHPFNEWVARLIQRR